MESPIHVSDLVERSQPLKRFCQWLRANPFLVIPLFLALYGYGSIDRTDFARLSASPLELHVIPGRQFLHSSPLTFFLGYPLTKTIGNNLSFAIVMAGGWACFVLALGWFAKVRYGSRRNDAMLMLFATPLLIVLSQFLGKSDPYLVAALLGLAAAASGPVQVLLACVVVLCHLEMGLMILGSAMFLRIVPWRTALVGGAIGALLVLGYQHYLLPAVPQSRAGIGMELLEESLDSVLSTPVTHLVLTFGPFWLCVLMARPSDWRWRMVLAATAAVSVITLDFTRVFVLVGLPMIIAVIDKAIRDAEAGDHDPRPAGWLGVLPLCAFVQAHLLSHLVFDSRMPELVRRLLE
jgi:hypothetical protein